MKTWQIIVIVVIVFLGFGGAYAYKNYRDAKQLDTRIMGVSLQNANFLEEIKTFDSSTIFEKRRIDIVLHTIVDNFGKRDYLVEQYRIKMINPTSGKVLAESTKPLEKPLLIQANKQTKVDLPISVDVSELLNLVFGGSGNAITNLITLATGIGKTDKEIKVQGYLREKNALLNIGIPINTTVKI